MLEEMQKKFIELAKKLKLSPEILWSIEEEFANWEKENDWADIAIVEVEMETSPEEIDKMSPEELLDFAKKMAANRKWDGSWKEKMDWSWPEKKNLQDKIASRVANY